MTESKVYITSKSKTFKEGDELSDMWSWFITNIDVYDTTEIPVKFKSKQKYKITITNLK